MATKQSNTFSELTDSERRDKSQRQAIRFSKKDLVDYIQDTEAPWEDADKFSAEVARVKHADEENQYALRQKIVDQLARDSASKYAADGTPMRSMDDINSEATKLWEEKAKQEALRLMQEDERKNRNARAARNEASKVLVESGALSAVLPHSLEAHKGDIQAQRSYTLSVPEIISNRSKEIGQYLNPKENEYFLQRFRDLRTPEDVQNLIKTTPAEYSGIHRVAKNILAETATRKLGAPREEGFIEGLLLTGGRVLSGVIGGGLRASRDYQLQALKSGTVAGGLEDVFRSVVEYARGTGMGILTAGDPNTVYGIGGARESKQALEKYLARGPAIQRLKEYKAEMQAKGLLPPDSQLTSDTRELTAKQIVENKRAFTDLKGMFKNEIRSELLAQGKTPAGEGFLDIQLQTTPEGTGNKLIEDIGQAAVSAAVGPEGYVLGKAGKALGLGLDAARASRFGPTVDKVEALFRSDASIDKTTRLYKKAGILDDKTAEQFAADLKFSRTEGSNAALTMAERLQQDLGEATTRRATLESFKDVLSASKQGPKSAWESIKKNSQESFALREYAKEQTKTAYTEARVASMHDTLYKHNMAIVTNSDNYASVLAKDIEAATGIPQVVLSGDIAKQYGRITKQADVTNVVLPKSIGNSIKELIQPSPSWTTNRLAEGAVPNAKMTEKIVANTIKGAQFANDYIYQPALNTLKVLTIFSNPSTAVNNFLTNVKLTFVQEGGKALNPTALAAASQSAITGALGKDLAPEITKKMAVSGFSHHATLYDLDEAFRKANGYSQARAHVGVTESAGRQFTDAVGNVVSATALGTKQMNVAGDVAFKKIAFVNKLQSLGSITDDNIKVAADYMNKMTGNYQAMGSYFDRVATNTVAWYNWKSFYWVRTMKNLVEHPDAMAALEQYAQFERDQAEAKTDKNLLLPGVISEYQKKFTIVDDPKLQAQFSKNEMTEGYVGKRHEKLTGELDDFIKASTGQKVLGGTPILTRSFAVLMIGHDPLTGQEIDIPGSDPAVRKAFNTLGAPVIKSFMTTFKLAMENNDYPTMFSLLNQLTFMSLKQMWSPLISWAVGARVVESPDLGAVYGTVTPDTRAWELGIDAAKKRQKAEASTRNADVINKVIEVEDETPEPKE